MVSLPQQGSREGWAGGQPQERLHLVLSSKTPTVARQRPGSRQAAEQHNTNPGSPGSYPSPAQAAHCHPLQTGTARLVPSLPPRDPEVSLLLYYGRVAFSRKPVGWHCPIAHLVQATAFSSALRLQDCHGSKVTSTPALAWPSLWSQPLPPLPPLPYHSWSAQAWSSGWLRVSAGPGLLGRPGEGHIPPASASDPAQGRPEGRLRARPRWLQDPKGNCSQGSGPGPHVPQKGGHCWLGC